MQQMLPAARHNNELTGYSDVNREAGANLDWDSIAGIAATTTAAGSWPIHHVKVAADSLWHYDRFRIRARWDYHYDNTAHWDTDSTFTHTPIFQHRLVGRYD